MKCKVRNDSIRQERFARRGRHQSFEKISKNDKVGISDAILESALTLIMDCEDSVAVVEAEDKVLVYGNWLGLMRGDLTEEVFKSGKTFTYCLNQDRYYTTPDGGHSSRPGRSLMLVCNVGPIRMLAPSDDQPHDSRQGRPQGCRKASWMPSVTALIALYDVGLSGRSQDSYAGSMYIIKTKIHRPEEVAFANEIFIRVETSLAWR